MNTTRVFYENLKAYNQGNRLISNRGGTRSSKTFSIQQLLYLIALKSQQPLIISVTGETLVHLRLGVMRDFISMLIKEGVYSERKHNKSENSYEAGKSLIEFFGADQEDKVRGPERDILFENECNKLKFDVHNALSIRTRKTIFVDYNPTAPFWLQENKLLEDPGSIEIVSTYRDNPYLTDEQLAELMRNKAKVGTSPYWDYWWQVYGEGEMGVMTERLIFKNVVVVDEIPKHAKKLPAGLDFGFSPDPTTCVDVYVLGEDLFIDELFYENNLLNVNIPGAERFSIADRLKQAGKTSLDYIVADSAEPKSIMELQINGWTRLYAVKKFPGSVLEGLRMMMNYRLCVTRRSVNVLRELRSYEYRVDRYGKIIPEPADNQSDHTIDAIRYVMLMKNALWK